MKKLLTKVKLETFSGQQETKAKEKKSQTFSTSEGKIFEAELRWFL